MSAMRIPFLLLSVSSLMGAVALGETLNDSDIANSVGGELREPTELSARDAIRSLARRAGLVIIFDGRKIEEQLVVEINPNASPRQELETVLAGLDLQLEPVGRSTFAITERPIASVPVRLDARPETAEFSFNDTIIVTGVSASAGPLGHEITVTQIDQDTIQLLSEAKVSDVIFELPQALASFSSANTTLYGATAGLNLADLRGAGPERTAVLVNGRRRTPISGGNGTVFAVDLTTLPHEFVKQVEVLDYSQAVSIGPEAVAGTVNIVLDMDTEGWESGLRYGLSEKGDAEQKSGYLKWGGPFAQGRGRGFAAVELVSEEGLVGGDRDVTSSPYGFSLNGVQSDSEDAEFTPGFAGSFVTANGLIAAALLEDGTRVSSQAILSQIILTPEGELENYEGRPDQLYNWSRSQSRILPNERVLGVGSLNFELTPDTDLFGEFHFGRGRTETRISALPLAGGGGFDPITGSGIRVQLDNPNVPEAVRAAFSGYAGGEVEELILTKRITSLGDRISTVDRDYAELVLGGEHRFSGATSITGYYRLGETSVDMTQEGLASRARLQAAITPELCMTLAGCIAANPFRADGFDAAADYIRVETEPTEITVTENEVYLDLATEADFFGNRRATFLFGGSWRESEIETRRPGDQSDILGLAPIAEFDGSIETGELFARMTYDLQPQESVIGALRLGGGGRMVHTSPGDWTENAEGFVDWHPVRGLTLRSVASYAERPPNLSEMYLVGTARAVGLSDPCSGLDPMSNSLLTQNCLSGGAIGVPEGFVQSGVLVKTPYYGDPDLGHETSQSWRADLILEPHELFGWSGGQSRLRLSYTDLQIDGVPDVVPDILYECYLSENLSSEYCGTNPLTGRPYIDRDPVTHELVEVGSPLINLHGYDWEGLDFEARFSQRPGNFGPVERVWATSLYTHIFSSEATWKGNLTNTPDYPRSRALFAAGFDLGPHQFAMQSQYRGEVQTADIDSALARIEPSTTFDVAWRYNLSERARLTTAISNLTDGEPEIAAFTEGRNVLAEHYDLIGRRFSVQLDVKF